MSATTLDTIGLTCPLPLLKLRQHLNSHGNAEVIVIVDDPNSLIDLPRFCMKQGLECQDVTPKTNQTDMPRHLHIKTKA